MRKSQQSRYVGPADVLPILLPTQRTGAVDMQQLRNCSRGDRREQTVMDELPTPTDLMARARCVPDRMSTHG